MAGSVILTTGSLVPNAIYKIKGYKKAEYLPQTLDPNFNQVDYAGYFGRFISDTSFIILADSNVNIVDEPIELSETEKFWYTAVDSSVVSSYVGIRSTLKNL